MKRITFSKNFQKRYKEIVQKNPNIKIRIEQRINLFQINRFDPILKDHILTGKMTKLRAFSITGDLRIIYYEDNEFYHFIDLGKHTQVYKM